MYNANLYIDNATYPAVCPSCGAEPKDGYLEKDWETGLLYCAPCGWDSNYDSAS